MPSREFARKLSAAVFVRKSRLVIGIDLTANLEGMSRKEIKSEKDRLEKEAISIISQTDNYAVAFKLNRHLILPLGLFDRIPRVIDAIHDEGLMAIMDCKMNDIGNTNRQIAQFYYDAGFDAVIANPLVGWEGGLDSVFELANQLGKGVLTLCYMSHPASSESFGLNIALDKKKKKHEPLYITFARRAKEWDADGIIVGATYPDVIREVKKIVGIDIPIFSPGIRVQGGSAREAIDAGASYVIAARSIVNAEDPGSAAANIAAETK